MAKFSLGDEVLVYQPSYRNAERGGTTKTTIVKEGRKYVYVDGEKNWRLTETPFDKETGRAKTNPKSSSHYNPVLWIPAEWDAKERRNDALERLRAAGVSFTRNYLSGADPRELPTEKLEKLLAVIQEDEPTPEGDTL